MNLTEYVAEVSRSDFGWEFKHTAIWNNRLRTTGGRFSPRDGHLEFNPKMYQEFDLDTFRKIVRHELCHYHLYFQNRGYRHRDREFKELLKRVNGLRYAPKMTRQVTRQLTYRCQSCHQTYLRQRRINLNHYCCGRCKGRLVFIDMR